MNNKKQITIEVTGKKIDFTQIEKSGDTTNWFIRRTPIEVKKAMDHLRIEFGLSMAETVELVVKHFFKTFKK